MALRVLVVDDDDSVRHLLTCMLPLGDSKIEVIGEARDGYEAVERAEVLQPDLIILDHVMPRRSGGDAVTDLLAVSPGSDILIFSAYLDSPVWEGSITAASREHGIDVIPKGALTDLEAAVSVVAARREPVVA